MSERFAIVARSTRGGFTESWHAGAVAVTTPGGRLVARIGDPQLSVILRSAAKPVQIVPLGATVTDLVNTAVLAAHDAIRGD